ncbi:zinc-binding dehydrogenase [Sinorhizobium medicae]|uniref:zinc-binding dehydrogenase n=1 Tax=Sinorhizobium medicae TaxID=110321 RepID=UPI001F21606A|nr:zinc-binding dehydrogenase [Sinorhizobium medicae]
MVLQHTDGWGANIVCEASRASKAIATLVDLCGPGGTIVLVGVPVHENSLDIAGAVNKEIEIRTVFRYANVLDRALNLIAFWGKSI